MARQVRVLPHVLQYEREDNLTRVKRCTARDDRGRICFAFTFACVVDKNPKTPKLSPIADDTITRGNIGSPVSLVYSCGITGTF